jgi:Na+-transporting NADH:ubiquinone oxidoreductase subunit A
LDQIKTARVTRFSGPHPAGNVGVQIHHVDPVGKGRLVWTMDIQHVAILGRFFRTGKADFSKIVAVTGSEVECPAYYSVISGAAVNSVLRGNLKDQPAMLRLISGNVLTGRRITTNGYLGYYHNQLTVIPEGDRHEFLGWIAPRFEKFSVSHSYFSWICPRKKYNLDTNLNGGVRAFVTTGLYEKYLPMDIYPMYLLKAILTGNITKMENLGIYEVIEEDFALCEFVDPSKTDMQEIIRRGIDQMIRELN